MHILSCASGEVWEKQCEGGKPLQGEGVDGRQLRKQGICKRQDCALASIPSKIGCRLSGCSSIGVKHCCAPVSITPVSIKIEVDTALLFPTWAVQGRQKHHPVSPQAQRILIRAKMLEDGFS